MPIVPSDIKLKYSTTAGSAGNTNTGTGAGSLGKYVSTTEVTTGLHDLFDVVTGAENAALESEYRCIFVHNTHATLTYQNPVIWVSAETAGGADIAISVDTTAASGQGSASAQAKEVANEDTAPSAQTFTTPVTEGTGLALSDIPALSVKAVWIRRTTTNSAALNNDGATLSISGDSAA